MNELTPHVSARHRFGAELRRRRIQQGMSQAELGEKIVHSASTVAKVENAGRWASQDFAQRSDSVLGSGGELLRLWEDAQRERAAKATDDSDNAIKKYLIATNPELGRSADLLSRLVKNWMDLRAVVARPGPRYLLIAQLDAAVSRELEKPDADRFIA
ncbi:helix-turn-helix domain-containing protein [Nocardia abscessus]|uniref:helix-turn-helix domain-containing protein n=1 Tax=Nocardia abscessus TaxID=120957 RepID=UPI00245545E8|nr:helix-turn-helix transcriptional regulator [Nocardia abscessus]